VEASDELATGGDARDKFMKEKASQRLGLRCAADPNELEEECLEIDIPAFADEGEICLLAHGFKIYMELEGTYFEEGKLPGGIERIWGNTSHFPDDE